MISSDENCGTIPSLRTVVDAMPGMIAYWDRGLRCRFANVAYLSWFGMSPERMAGVGLRDFLGPALFAKNRPFIDGALRGAPQCFERSLRKADGTVGDTLASYIPDVEDDGNVRGFFVLVTDVSRLKAAQRELELAASIFENATDGVMVTDADGVITSVNPAFATITGFTAAEAVGQTPRLLKSNREPLDVFPGMWQQLTTTGRWQGKLWNRHKEGGEYLQEQTITALHDPVTESVRYVSIFSDVTERWQADEHLRRLAFHDFLTGLPNRALVIDRLERVTRDFERVAVMFVDLDGFKAVNDSCGHEFGDRLLRAVAQRLERSVRRSDIVGRVGGDEFVIVLPAVDNDELERIGRSILAAVREPIHFRDSPVCVSASVGIAVFPDNAGDAADLLKQADAAMYAAKAVGKNTLAFS